MQTLNDPRLFPVLTEAQIRHLPGVEERVPDGTVLIAEGQQDYDFFVVLEGAVDILQESRLIVRHEPGEFVGDPHTLSRRAAVVSAVAVGDTRVLRVTAADLQRLVVERTELSDLILRSFLNRRLALVKGSHSSTRVIGSRFSSDTHRIREFLTRNGQPFVWLDLETDPTLNATLDGFGVAVEDTPVVICRGEHVHRNPSNAVIARGLGLDVLESRDVVDVLVVGAGPAGLAATVYAASEGLEVVTLDAIGPGGQAGTSSKIENYLGFPTGISGQELADRALLQAQKFGAQVGVALHVERLDCEGPVYAATTRDGRVVRSRSVVVATGARYRRPDVPGLEDYEGKGVYYGATPMEGTLCRGAATVVVGGGNSAGQACVYLSSVAREVHLVIRGDDLSASMSRYLIRRIEETSNIHLHTRTEVAALEGDGHLERVRLTCRRTGASTEVATPGLFLMIGATPNTDWLCGAVALDPKGFVLTGRDLGDEALDRAGWPLARTPFAYETSKPRIFAVGDVRSDSTKRVATAVGEGSAAVQFLHRALADLA